MIRRKGLIFKRQQFIFCFLIFFSISLVGENQRMFSQHDYRKHWGLKTASANIGGHFIIGASLALMLYSLDLIFSDDPLIFSDIEVFLENNQLTKDFNQEEIVGVIEGFLMSRFLKGTESIKDWNEDQKSKLMILAIILSSTQSDDKQEIRTLLNRILRDILDKIRWTLVLITEETKTEEARMEEAGIKIKFAEAVELTALNLRKNASRNSLIEDEIVEDIERQLKLILKQIIENNSRDQKVIDKTNQALNTLNKLQSQSSISSQSHGSSLNIETLFSGFSASGIDEFINTLTKPLDKKRIVGLIEGFLMFKLLEGDGDLMYFNPNQDIELWTKDQKTKLMILSIGLALLVSRSEKNRDILLNELGSMLSKTRGSIKNYKEDDKKEIETRFIDALGFIAFNLVETNKSLVTDHLYTYHTISFILKEFAEHKDPIIRSKVLDFIKKVGQINIEKKGKLSVYEMSGLLMQLSKDEDSSINKKAQDVMKSLNLKIESSCFGIFQKLALNNKPNQ